MKTKTAAFICMCAPFLFFFCACGIDVYYMLEPPTGQLYTMNRDPATRYLTFNTNAAANTDLGDVYQGVKVYYRLYNSESQMNSDISRINSANSEYSSNGANRMISIGYQPLRIRHAGTGQEEELLVRDSGQVRIRFYTEGQSNAPHPAAITHNENTIGVPLRYAKDDGFDFFSDDDRIRSDTPEDGDVDAYTGGTETNVWYVNAYAVSYGRDASWTDLYSELLHLGYITITPE